MILFLKRWLIKRVLYSRYLFKGLVSVVFKKVREIFINTKWFLVIAVLGFAFYLPLPNIFLNNTYKPTVSYIDDKRDVKASIQLENSSLSSASLMTKILRTVGQEYKSPDISICLINDFRRPSKEVLDVLGTTTSGDEDDFGSMSIKIKEFKSENVREVFARISSTTCEAFPGDHIQVIDADDMQFVTFRLLIFNGEQDILAQHVDFGDTKIKIEVDFDVWEYLFNVFIILVALGIVIQSGNTLLSLFTKEGK